MATGKPFASDAALPAGTIGAYGSGAGMRPDLRMALDKPLPSQKEGSTAFTENDRRWMKELGITVADPVEFKRIWSPAFEKHWQTRRWSESYSGRLAMRSVSRFVVGSAFYAIAQTYGTHAMGKNGEKWEAYTNGEAHNALQHIAKFIDNTAGKTIQFAVKHAPGGNAEKALNATMFRDTVDFGYKNAAGHSIMGRSLGHEALAVTFDFATMSFGDYMTRYVIGLFDPNARAQWLQDGHISPTQALKDVFRNIFRGVTYAAGEDMAVAIPYVYYMKGQRHLINKASPGFKYDFDGGTNGGSFKIKDDKVVGNYQLEGMIDLMGRFSWYNVGTKMFRDGYNAAEEKLGHWWQGGHKVEMHAPKDANIAGTARGALQGVKDSIRYVMRTTIKTMLYMVPSTFFFYATRAPQSKIRGLAIDPEHGILVREQHANGNGHGNGNGNAFAKENMGSTEWISSQAKYKPVKPGSEIHEDDVLFYRDEVRNYHPDGTLKPPAERIAVANPFVTDNHQAAFSNTYYEKHGTKAPWHDSFTNPVAKLSYGMGSLYNRLLGPLTKRFYKADIGAKAMEEGKHLDPEAFQHAVDGKAEIFARRYANAALSYTPYFMAKSDVLSAFLDTARTDMAIDRMLHGAAHLRWGEFKTGLSEMFRAVRKEPFTDPKREVMAQAAMVYDTEKFSNEAYQVGYSGYSHSGKSGAREAQNTFATEETGTQNRRTFTQLAPAPVSMQPEKWKKDIIDPMIGPEALKRRAFDERTQSFRDMVTPENTAALRRKEGDANWAAREEATRQFSEEQSRQGVSVH